jgi:hypothetical protein
MTSESFSSPKGLRVRSNGLWFIVNSDIGIVPAPLLILVARINPW